jgi:hypothetical protein
MYHRYPTRFQTTALEKTVEYSRDVIADIEKAPTFIEKLQHLIILYNHFYEEPRLLTNYESFRAATWAKMNEQEVMLLEKLQTLPNDENNDYNTPLKNAIYQVLILIGSLRSKYW